MTGVGFWKFDSAQIRLDISFLQARNTKTHSHSQTERTLREPKSFWLTPEAWWWKLTPQQCYANKFLWPNFSTICLKHERQELPLRELMETILRLEHSYLAQSVIYESNICRRDWGKPRLSWQTERNEKCTRSKSDFGSKISIFP